jgi:hypothetical protein
LKSSAWDQSRYQDWRNDIEGLGALFSTYIPNYRNLVVYQSS